jgi:hypothetical protein
LVIEDPGFPVILILFNWLFLLGRCALSNLNFRSKGITFLAYLLVLVIHHDIGFFYSLLMVLARLIMNFGELVSMLSVSVIKVYASGWLKL